MAKSDNDDSSSRSTYDSSSDDNNSNHDDDDDDDKRRRGRKYSKKRHHSSRKSSSMKKHKKKKKKKDKDIYEDRHSGKKKYRRDYDDYDDDHDDNDNSSKSDGSYSDSDNNGSDDEDRRVDNSKIRRKSKREDNKRHRDKKKSKKKKKHRKRKDDNKKRRRHRHEDDDDDDDGEKESRRSGVSSNKRPRRNESHEVEDRNTILADALFQLFTYHPPLASDLPIMLIRLAGGTTFDLNQMTDSSAAMGLSQVFHALKPFGLVVQQDEQHQQQQGNGGSWSWKAPAGAGRNRDELVLVKLVRAMMDQAGITTTAINSYEDNLKNPPSPAHSNKNSKASSNHDRESKTNAIDTSKVEHMAQEILKIFAGGEDKNDDDDDARSTNDDQKENNKSNSNKLSQELAGLCNMILIDDESISLDGLPDEKLRSHLEALFEKCGLEKSEMEVDDDDDGSDDDSADKDEENDSGPTMGYALPDENEGIVRSMLAAAVQIFRVEKKQHGCSLNQNHQQRNPTMKGPVLPGQDTWGENTNNNNNDDGDSDSSDNDEVGPAPIGAQKGPALPPELIKARAKQRAKQMERVKSGMDPSSIAEDNVREEWMLVPGKFDFLGSIKSGQPIRSRKFEAKSKSDHKDGDGGGQQPIDPKVQAEVDAIKRAHDESRGPSLMEVHRQKKAADAAAKAAAASDGKSASSASWKWNRDKDLDSGRRVDKDALKMVLGGASTGLKSKFQGGFG